MTFISDKSDSNEKRRFSDVNPPPSEQWSSRENTPSPEKKRLLSRVSSTQGTPGTPTSKKPALPESPKKPAFILKRRVSLEEGETDAKVSRFPTFLQTYAVYLNLTHPLHPIDEPATIDRLYAEACQEFDHYQIHFDLPNYFKFLMMIHQDINIGNGLFAGWNFTNASKSMLVIVNYLFRSKDPNIKKASPVLKKFCEILDNLVKESEKMGKLKTQADVEAWAKQTMTKIWHLSANESYFLPSGWSDNHHGHAMVEKYFREANASVGIKIFNTGAATNYHLKIVSDKKIRAVRNVRFKPVPKKDLFFSSHLTTADPSMLVAKAEFQQSEKGKLYAFGGEYVYSKAHSHIRDAYEPIEGKPRTLQRGGSCSVEVLMAILDDLFTEEKHSIDQSNELLYKYTKFYIKLATLTAFNNKWSKLIPLLEDSEKEKVENFMYLSSLKLLRSAAKLLQNRTIDYTLASTAYAVGKKISEQAKNLIDARKIAQSAKTEHYSFTETSKDFFPGAPPCLLLPNNKAPAPSFFKFPVNLLTPEPDEVCSHLQSVLNFIGPLEKRSIGDPQVENDLFVIENCIELLPVPKANDPSDFWNKVPQSELSLCISHLSSLMDSYSLLFFSLHYPNLPHDQKRNRLSDLKTPYYRNMFLKLIAITHALAIRQDEEWRKTTFSSSQTSRPLSTYRIAFPDFGCATNGVKGMIGDRYQVFNYHENYNKQLELINYFGAWNGSSVSQSGHLFSITGLVEISIEDWKNTADYKYFKELLALVPLLKKETETNLRIYNAYHCPQEVLNPIELMLDTGVAMDVMGGFGDASNRKISSPLAAIGANHLTTLRKAYVLFNLTQYGDVKLEGVDYRSSRLCILIKDRKPFLFGNGAFYFSNEHSVARLPYSENLEKSTVNFIEFSSLNQRFFDTIVHGDTIESQDIISPSPHNISTSRILKTSFRGWFANNIQLTLILDRFQESLNELDNPSVQQELMYILFKDFNLIRDGVFNNYHPLYDYAIKNPAFVKRLSNFLNSAIDFQFKRNPKALNPKTVLFIFKIAYSVTMSVDLEKPLISNASLVLGKLLTAFKNNPKVLGGVHFFYCAYLITTSEEDQADEKLLKQIIYHYSFYMNFGLDKGYKDPELENWVKTAFFQLIPKIEDYLASSNTVPHLVEKFVTALELNPANVPKTIQAFDNHADCMINNSIVFSWNFKTFKMFIANSVSEMHPGWSQPNLRKILNSKKYPTNSISENLQFFHPIFKSLRFVPDQEKPGQYLLQIQYLNEWYTYIDPVRCITSEKFITSYLPPALWMKYSLWTIENKDSIILENASGNLFCNLGIGGNLYGNNEILCSEFYTKQNPINTYLGKFENLNLILTTKNKTDEIATIDFVCLNQDSGLTFKLDNMKRLVWKQNKNYYLSTSRPLGLLGSIDDYLYLESSNGSNPKILVGHKVNNRNPNLEDFTSQAALTKPEEDNVLDLVTSEIPKVNFYFEFEVKGRELIPADLTAKIKLAYLFTIQKEFDKAISIFKTTSSLEPISELAFECLHDLTHYEGFEDPPLFAIKMHAILMCFERMKRDDVKVEDLNVYLSVYLKYLNTLSNIKTDHQLKRELELFILTYMFAISENPGFTELLLNRKAELSQGQSRTPVKFRTKITDVLSIPFGTASPLTQEQINKIPVTLKKSNINSGSVLDPGSISDNFYYWYNIAISKDTSSKAIQNKRLLRYRLGLLSRSDTNSNAIITNTPYTLLEYLRVAVLVPQGFSPCPPKIEPTLMASWFSSLHEQYFLSSIISLASNTSPTDLNEESVDFEQEHLPEIDDLVLSKRKHVPMIDDLDEYNLSELKKLFEIPETTPKIAPKLFEFQHNELKEDLEPYAKAIEAEHKKFQSDFEEGYNQIHNAKKYLLPGDLQVLIAKLEEKLSTFRSHFKQLSEAALKFANTPSSVDIVHLEDLLEATGGTKVKITFERLVGCLLTKDWSLLQISSSNLTTGQIEDIHKLTLQSVWIGVHIQSLERCLTIAKDSSLQKDDKSQKIGEELFVRRKYPPQKYPSILAQEFLKGIKLRTYQGEFLEKSLKTTKVDGVEKYDSGVFQVPPGGGKSSELVPQLGFQAANGKRLALYLALPSQYETLKRQIPKNQMDYFGQETECISFNREELTPENIDTLYTLLFQAIIRKRLVLMPSDFPSILFVHWVDLMFKEINNFSNESETEELSATQLAAVKLKDIFRIFDRITDALGDEADLFLSIFHETSIMAKEKNVPPSWFKIISVIFKEVIRNPQILKVMKETSNFQLATAEKIKSEVIPLLISHLFNAGLFEMVPDIYHEACVNFLRENINPEYEKYIENPFPSNLPSIEINKIEFLRWLRVQALQPYQDNFSVADHISVIKHILNDVIVNTLRKKPNRYYGWVKNNTAIGPYKASDTPTTNSFGYIFDELSYYFQMAIFKPIPMEFFKNYITQKLKMAEDISTVSSTHIEETEIGKRLTRLLGTSPRNLDFENLEKPLNYINSDPFKRFEILAELASQNVRYQTAVISSNSLNQARRYNTLRVVSGTPYNYHSFDSFVSKNYQENKGSEGQIAEALLRHAADSGSHIHVLNTTNPFEVLNELKDAHPQFNLIHAITDDIGLFSTSDHTSNVISICKFFTNELKSAESSNKRPRIKAIFTFFKDSRSDEALIPGLFNLETQKASLHVGTLRQDFKNLGFELEEIFYYIPENQSTGSHADMPAHCINLLTLGIDGTQRTLFQGACRSRLVQSTQKIEYLILKTTVEKYPELAASIHKNIRHGLANQGFEIANQVMAMYSTAPVKEPGILALKEILRTGSFRDMMKQFTNFSEAFLTSTEIPPYLLFGSLKHEVHPKEIIKLAIKTAVKKWGQKLPQLKPNLDKLYRDAKASPYLPTKTKFNNAQRMGMHTQNLSHVQAQSQVQSQVKVELEMYRSKEARKDIYSEMLWTKEDIINLLNFEESSVLVISLANHLSDTQSMYPHEYYKIFDPEILATENFLLTHTDYLPIFSDIQKQGTQILLQQLDCSRYSATFLSINEASVFAKEMEALYKSFPPNSIHLVTADGQSFYDDEENTPPPVVGQLLRLLIQVNLFNGNLAFLEKYRVHTLKWLMEKDTDLKIRFLKIKVENNPFYKELLQNGSFKHLL